MLTVGFVTFSTIKASRILYTKQPKKLLHPKESLFSTIIETDKDTTLKNLHR